MQKSRVGWQFPGRGLQATAKGQDGAQAREAPHTLPLAGRKELSPWVFAPLPHTPHSTEVASGSQ